jgi:hypothetical protein
MWVAYLDLSRRSEQLSCSKFFDPDYGLKDMIFQSFKEFLEFNYLFKFELSRIVKDDVSMT